MPRRGAERRAETLRRLLLVVVTDERRCRGGLLESCGRALRGGATAVLLRDRDLPRSRRRSLARALRAITARSGAALLVHTDAALAREADADGVHLDARADARAIAAARDAVGPDRVVGVSTHSRAEVRAAARRGADYAFLGPVGWTRSHPASDGMGATRFAELARGAGIPTVAIGGIAAKGGAGRCPTWAMTAMTGPFRAAAIDALLRAKDPEKAAAAMLAGLSPPPAEPVVELAERSLVRGILERMGHPAILALGPGDDAVVLRTPGAQVAAATDLTVEGVHYRKGGTGKAAGFKAAARALSDLAAVGARPVGLMVGVALRGRKAHRKAAAVQSGIDRAAATWGAPILGGDTKETPGTELIAVTALGVVEGPPALPRSGGRPGDALFVSGPLGGSIRGRHLRPRPRIGVGLALRQGGLATACIDISDGLATDLHRLCRASGAGALLESWRVPIHPDARRGGERDPLSRALFDGEDYELLFAVPPAEAPRVESEGVAKRRVHRVGRLVHPSAGVLVQGRNGLVHPLPDAGWSHFRRARP